jgi:4-alpha-glucanotransferase
MNHNDTLLHRMRRMARILLHPTSLPGIYGIGDLGPEARKFVDFLQEAGQHLWQTLPVGPTGWFHCPYQCYSSFAGEPLLISPDLLAEEGLLSEEDLAQQPDFPADHVDFEAVAAYKKQLFDKAYSRFTKLEKRDPLYKEFEVFCDRESWLEDYAMFMAIRKSKDESHWLTWEKKYRRPTKSQKAVIQRELEQEIAYEKFLQWLFFRQWKSLKEYANDHDVLLIGDIPIFVAEDSADVWAEPSMFLLDKDGFPTVVSGVPPDYFSETGQRWGNPLYNWKQHKKTGFAWWIRRFETMFELCDIVRIDHFRGLESYWEIPADEETALNGKWAPGPGADFFRAVFDHFGEDVPIIAEDLGTITDEVRALRDDFGLPGMKILQFAFEDYDSAYLPYNQPYNSVCYTGTHDNDTTAGWYEKASERVRDRVRRYMNTDGSQISWDFIRTCLGSPARFAIAPIQDLLCQGSESRMNTPGVAEGNWTYRFRSGLLTSDIAGRLREMTHLFGR